MSYSWHRYICFCYCCCYGFLPWLVKFHSIGELLNESKCSASTISCPPTFVCHCHTYSTKGNEFHLSKSNKLEKVITYQTLLLAITCYNVIQFHDWVFDYLPNSLVTFNTKYNPNKPIYNYLLFQVKMCLISLINQRIINTKMRRKMWIHSRSLAEPVWGPCFDDSKLGKSKRSWSRTQRLNHKFFMNLNLMSFSGPTYNELVYK